MTVTEFEEEMDRMWWRGFTVGVIANLTVSTVGLIVLHMAW